MKDRLIELLKIIREHPEKTCADPDAYNCDGCRYDLGGIECDVVARFADYLIANGVIVLPFPIGTTYYRIVTKRAKAGFPYHKLIREAKLNWYNLESVISDFGKTVFLTREEAEKALEKEM